MAQSILSQGDIYPVRHEDMVQANAGYGQYNPASYPLAPFGSSPDGIGAYSRLGHMPVPKAYNSGVLGKVLSVSPLVQGLRAMSGLGDTTAAPATPASSASPAVAASGEAIAGASAILVAAALTGLVLSGMAGYFVGKAVAPSRDKESKYAWWGVFAGLVGGPVGLGIEAIVALEHK